MAGDLIVGRAWSDARWPTPPTWSWSLTVTGYGVDRRRFRTYGTAYDKDEAKAALETAWLAFLAAADDEGLAALRSRGAV